MSNNFVTLMPKSNIYNVDTIDNELFDFKGVIERMGVS